MSVSTYTPASMLSIEKDSYTIKGVRVIDVYPRELEKGDVIVELVGLPPRTKVSKTVVDRVDQKACSTPNSTHVNGKDCYDNTATVAIAV